MSKLITTKLYNKSFIRTYNNEDAYYKATFIKNRLYKINYENCNINILNVYLNFYEVYNEYNEDVRLSISRKNDEYYDFCVWYPNLLKEYFIRIKNEKIEQYHVEYYSKNIESDDVDVFQLDYTSDIITKLFGEELQQYIKIYKEIDNVISKLK